MTCWMVRGGRQASRIRSLYFKTILREDIPFLAKETNTSEVVRGMYSDTVLIQDARGEKIIYYGMNSVLAYFLLCLFCL